MHFRRFFEFIHGPTRPGCQPPHLLHTGGTQSNEAGLYQQAFIYVISGRLSIYL